MKIDLQLTDLKQAISNVQRSIPTNPQLPILSSILFDLTKKDLTLAATDLYLGVKTKLSVKSNEAVTAAIPGLMFKDLINSFNSDKVAIKIESDSVELKSGTSTAKIPVRKASEYPDFPEVNGQDIRIPVKVLEEILQMVGYAASTDQVRPILTTIMFDYTDSGLEVVATDGFRLAILKYPELKAKFSKKLLIPVKSFTEICRIVEQGNSEEVVMQVDQELKQVKINVDQNEMYVRLIEGEYPPYEKIIPETHRVGVELNTEEFRNELQRASILAREASNIVQFHLKPKRLIITSVSPSSGEYKSEIACAAKQDDVDEEIAFDIRYLLDFLNNIETDSLFFQMNEGLKPATFTIEDRSDFAYIVMPFRVNR